MSTSPDCVISNAEIFRMPLSNASATQAVATCQNLKSSVASLTQLRQAAIRGANWPGSNWVLQSDTDEANKYGSPWVPATIQAPAVLTSPSNTAGDGVVCVGTKPAASDPWSPLHAHDPSLPCTCPRGYTRGANNTCTKACCTVCTNVDATTGRCMDCDAKQAQKLSGTLLGKGPALFEPTLVMDPNSLEILGNGTNPATCARSLSSVLSMFKDAPTESVQFKLKNSAEAPDIYQIFYILKSKGVYVPPKPTGKKFKR